MGAYPGVGACLGHYGTILTVPLIIFIAVHCYHFHKHRRSCHSPPSHLPPPSTTKQRTAPTANKPTVSESPNTVTWSTVTKSGDSIAQVTVQVTQISPDTTEMTSEQSKNKNLPGLMSVPPPPYSEKDTN